MRETEENYYSEEEYINLGAVLRDYIHYFKKRWFILVLLILLCLGAVFEYNKLTEKTTYQASVSYTVEKSSSVYTNAQITARLANGISAITSTNDFRKELSEIIGEKNILGTYSFKGKATPSANMMTITVTTDDSETASALIKAFEEIYPDWAARSIGNAILNVKEEELNKTPIVETWSISKILIFGLAAGCLLWLILATITNMLICRVRSLEDMNKVTNTACIGIVPDVRKKKRDRSRRESLLISNENCDIAYQQSIRSLRHTIEKSEELKDKKVYLITSTHPEEGKSVITMNLALAFHQLGKKVLVIDGNLHSNSGIQEILNLSNCEKSLRGYLKNEYDDVSIQMKEEIFAICSGASDDKDSFIPDMKRFSTLVEKLRKYADIILIDSAQMTDHADAVLFSEAADAVFYVIRGDYAEIKEIRKGMEPFIQNHKLAGFILNRIKGSSTGYQYYYGYGYSHYRTYRRDYNSKKYSNKD